MLVTLMVKRFNLTEISLYLGTESLVDLGFMKHLVRDDLAEWYTCGSFMPQWHFILWQLKQYTDFVFTIRV